MFWFHGSHKNEKATSKLMNHRYMLIPMQDGKSAELYINDVLVDVISFDDHRLTHRTNVKGYEG